MKRSLRILGVLAMAGLVISGCQLDSKKKGKADKAAAKTGAAKKAATAKKRR